MAKKTKRSKSRISAREFEVEFTAIIGGYLATLPPAEQDKRLRAVKRLVTRRVASSTKQSAARTSQARLAGRNHK